ncbi:11501_t:CDS:2, partial [Ambispora leptoticha]
LKEEVNKSKLEKKVVVETEKKEEAELKMEPETIKFLDKYCPKEKRKNIEILNISKKNLKGHLDLREFVSLGCLNCFGNQLTSLDLSKCVDLEELFCQNNQLTSIDVSHNPKLTDLYLDNVEIIGLKKTSIIRFGCSGDLLRANISNLNKIAGQVNEEIANNEEFLKKICPLEAEEFIESQYYKTKQGRSTVSDEIIQELVQKLQQISKKFRKNKNDYYDYEPLYLDYRAYNLV